MRLAIYMDGPLPCVPTRDRRDDLQLPHADTMYCYWPEPPVRGRVCGLFGRHKKMNIVTLIEAIDDNGRDHAMAMTMTMDISDSSSKHAIPCYVLRLVLSGGQPSH